MPYIVQEKRDKVDQSIRALVEALQQLSPSDDFDEGLTNYTITRLITGLLKTPKYSKINKAIGVLECVKAEFYRRLAGPYEDGAVERNGDIPEYKGKG